MKNFLILFQGTFGQTTRPTRIAKYLQGKGRITVCSYGQTPEIEKAGHEFVLLNKQNWGLLRKVARGGSLFLGRFEADVWTPEIRRIFELLKTRHFDGIFCHDPVLLPLSLALRDEWRNKGHSSCVVLDAREYYPRHFENSLAWRNTLGRLNKYLTSKYFSKADCVFTVSPGIAAEYELRYGFRCSLLPSYAPYHDILPVSHEGGIVRCIHHGGGKPGRKLELMAAAMALLGDQYSLDFMLVENDPGYCKSLKKQTADIDNVRFLDPVPMEEIVNTTSSYDVGLFLLPPNTFNHRHALPNKLFEFLQARLAIVVGPTPDMAEFVLDNELGLVTEDFTPAALAACLKKLTRDDINRFKESADKAARKYCWEQNEVYLDKELAQVFEWL